MAPRLDVRAGLEVPERLAVLAAALVARAHTHDNAVLDDQLRGGRLGQHVGAGLFGLLLLEACQRRDGDHLVAMVLKRRWGGDAQSDFGGGCGVNRLLCDLAEGEALLAPLLAGHLGEQLLKRLWPYHRTREVVPTTDLGLLDHGDRNFAQALHRLGVLAEQLQQPVGAGQPGCAAADDRNADLDSLILTVEGALDELLLGVDRRRVGRRDDLPVAGPVVATHRFASPSSP